MLIVTDLNSDTEALTDYQGLTRKRRVNGEYSLSFLVFKSQRNEHSYDLCVEESLIEYDGQTYRIKEVTEKLIGSTPAKQIRADHIFFDLVDTYQYDVIEGTKTIANFIAHALQGTEYTYDVIDAFGTRYFEKFGDDNSLSLIQLALNTFGAEVELDNKHLTIKAQAGRDTDIQFRFKHNVKTIEKYVNTNNLSTTIKGYGKKNEDGSYVCTAEYTSPMAEIYGIRHAKPVYDERYTVQSELLARIQSELIDTPEISFKIDAVELKKAGVLTEQLEPGDRVFVIYEPLGIDIIARVMEIIDYPESNVPAQYTFENFRNNITDTLADFRHTKDNVDSILNGERKLPYNVLDDAVIRATEALKSAQTELSFENGIIAIDPTDPNRLVLINSKGVGISDNGGATFREAITGDGFVLSAGVIGQLKANNIDVGDVINNINGGSTQISGGVIKITDNSDFQTVSQKASNALDKFKDYVDKTLYGQDLASIQSQIDGSITTWFYNYVPTLTNLPASNWNTNEKKNVHLGDLFYDTTTGYAYRFTLSNSVYSWAKITDTDVTKALSNAQKAQDTADSKRRVFVVQPIPPYDIGDLWTQGSTGDLMRCKVARASGVYVSSDWEKASKYTDDTLANEAKTSVETAMGKLNDLAADSKLTPIEKIEVKREWEIIKSEKPVIDEQAQKYGALSSDWEQGYPELQAYIEPLLADMTITSTIDRAIFNAKFKKYYDGKILISRLISDRAKDLADSAQSDAAASKTIAEGAQTTAKAANDQVILWKYPGTTEINGGSIRTNSVVVNKLIAGILTSFILQTHVDASKPRIFLGPEINGDGTFNTLKPKFEATSGNKKVRISPSNWADSTAIELENGSNGFLTMQVYDNRASFTGSAVEFWTFPGVEIMGSLSVIGSKNASVPTSIGYVNISAYETAEYYFGDIGRGEVVNGECTIEIESLFKETVNTNIDYEVFLTPYGNGVIYVDEMNPDYFVVRGDDIKFAYEIKAKRKGYETVRLELTHESEVDEFEN